MPVRPCAIVEVRLARVGAAPDVPKAGRWRDCGDVCHLRGVALPDLTRRLTGMSRIDDCD